MFSFLRDAADVFRSKKGQVVQVTFKEFIKNKETNNDYNDVDHESEKEKKSKYNTAKHWQ